MVDKQEMAFEWGKLLNQIIETPIITNIIQGNGKTFIVFPTSNTENINCIIYVKLYIGRTNIFGSKISCMGVGRRIKKTHFRKCGIR